MSSHHFPHYGPHGSNLTRGPLPGWEGRLGHWLAAAKGSRPPHQWQTATGAPRCARCGEPVGGKADWRNGDVPSCDGCSAEVVAAVCGHHALGELLLEDELDGLDLEEQAGLLMDRAGLPAMSIAAVLLIPSEAHREALIGDGPCGSRAPVAFLTAGRWKASAARRFTHYRAGTRGKLALVLRWDGEPVADGLARFRRVLDAAAGPGGVRWPSRAGRGPSDAQVLGWAERTAKAREPIPIGRVVLLDATGRELADG